MALGKLHCDTGPACHVYQQAPSSGQALRPLCRLFVEDAKPRPVPSPKQSYSKRGVFGGGPEARAAIVGAGITSAAIVRIVAATSIRAPTPAVPKPERVPVARTDRRRMIHQEAESAERRTLGKSASFCKYPARLHHTGCRGLRGRLALRAGRQPIGCRRRLVDHEADTRAPGRQSQRSRLIGVIAACRSPCCCRDRCSGWRRRVRDNRRCLPGR